MIVPLLKLGCNRCGYEWVPRTHEVYVCPNCNVPIDKVHPYAIVEGSLNGFEVEEREKFEMDEE